MTDVRKSYCIVPLLISLAGAARAEGESCVPASKAISADQAASFRASPTGAATDGQVGTTSTRIRNAIVSDPSLLSALTPTMKTATGDQAVAVGTGLGAAAQVCVKQHPAVAQAIQQSIAAANNQDVSRAFAGIVGDVPVLSVSAGSEGPGADSGGASPGGGTRRAVMEVNYQFRNVSSEDAIPSISSGSRARSSSSGSTVLVVGASSTAASSMTPEDALVSVSGAR